MRRDRRPVSDPRAILRTLRQNVLTIHHGASGGAKRRPDRDRATRADSELAGERVYCRQRRSDAAMPAGFCAEQDTSIRGVPCDDHYARAIAVDQREVVEHAVVVVGPARCQGPELQGFRRRAAASPPTRPLHPQRRVSVLCAAFGRAWIRRPHHVCSASTCRCGWTVRGRPAVAPPCTTRSSTEPTLTLPADG